MKKEGINMDSPAIALVGCGGWGRNLARNLHQLEALRWIVDPADTAVSMARELGVCHAADLEEALEDGDVQGVAIASPAVFHHAHAMSAFRAGKHVYVEKPIATSIEDANAMSDAARRHQRVLMVGHLMQYHPVYRELVNLVTGQRFGELKHIVSHRLNLGILRNEENVMWSFAPHDVSMLLGLVGAMPSRVAAIGNDFLQKGIADFSTVHFEFPSGQTAEICSGWLNPEKVQKLVVIGDKAMAVFDDRQPWEDKLLLSDYTIATGQGRPKVELIGTEKAIVPFDEPLRLEMQHFLDCIRGGCVPRTDADEAIRVLAVLQAAETSLANDGKWINV